MSSRAHAHVRDHMTPPDDPEATREGPPPPGRAPGASTAWPATIGPYRVLGVLGEGGMGIVYEAEQQHPRRRVALKVIRGGSFVDERRVTMFQREIDTLARLDHPSAGLEGDAGARRRLADDRGQGPREGARPPLRQRRGLCAGHLLRQPQLSAEELARVSVLRHRPARIIRRLDPYSRHSSRRLRGH
jgi:serine/threonine protein kinase